MPEVGRHFTTLVIVGASMSPLSAAQLPAAMGAQERASPAAAQILTQKIQVTGFIVGDLGNPTQRQRFDEQARATCGKLLNVQEERREDTSPPGSIVEQRPPAGERVACIGGGVTLVYSLGPKPIPVIQVPRLDSEEIRASFEATVLNRCDQPFTVNILSRRGMAPAGSYIRQSRGPGTTIGCSEDVAVFVSDGSVPSLPQPPEKLAPPPPKDIEIPLFVPPPEVSVTQESAPTITVQQQVQQTAPPVFTPPPPLPPSPPSPPPLLVGSLDTPALRAGLEASASAFCKMPYRIQIDFRKDSASPGSFISQSVAADSRFTCARPKIVVTLSAGRPTPLAVPRLDSEDIRIRFESTVRKLCTQPFRLEIIRIPGTPPLGDYLRQSPGAGQTIRCGQGATAYVSDGSLVDPPPPWWIFATAIGGILVAAGVSRRMHIWPWPPIPKIEVDLPKAAVIRLGEAGVDAALPLLALEAVSPKIRLMLPQGLPIETVENSNGG